MKDLASIRHDARLNRSLSIYRQIEAILREQIVSGEYSNGDRLPTESELSSLYRVSRPTIRQALEGLEAEKLVRREQGRGTFVEAPGSVRLPERHAFSIEDLIDPTAPVAVSIQRSGTIRGRGLAHEMMELPHGAELFYFVRIYSLAGQPIGGAKVHVPMALGAKLRTKDLVSRNVPRMLAQRSGARLGAATLSIDAGLAEPRFAEMLRVRPGVPVICVRRTTYDHHGKAIEHSHMLFRPELCHLTARNAFRAK
jgi:GntR family transcriptional regulator